MCDGEGLQGLFNWYACAILEEQVRMVTIFGVGAAMYEVAQGEVDGGDEENRG